MSPPAALPARSHRPARAPRAGAAAPRRRRAISLRSRLRRDRTLILMTMPMVVLLLVFAYIPILGNVIAFQDYSPFVGIRSSSWVGTHQIGKEHTF